jgi:hypothetical protein
LFLEIEGSEQQTTVQRRENRVSKFRKAIFGLRLRAGLAAPNRSGISPFQPMDRLSAECGFEPRLNQRKTGRFRRTAGFAADWFKLSKLG